MEAERPSGANEQSQAALRTNFNWDDPHFKAVLRWCKQRKNADPWNPLLCFLSQRERRGIKPGYPIRFGSNPTKHSGASSSVSTSSNSCTAQQSHGDASTNESSATEIFSGIIRSVETLDSEPPCRLWCEHRHVLGCDAEFSIEDEDAWIDHHRKHLDYKYPRQLACWHCGNRTFVADMPEYKGKEVEDVDESIFQTALQTATGKNFELRMRHIARHIAHEFIAPMLHEPDILLLDFMKEQGIIGPERFEELLKTGLHSLGQRRLTCAVEFGYDQLLPSQDTNRMEQTIPLNGIGPGRYSDFTERNYSPYLSNYNSADSPSTTHNANRSLQGVETPETASTRGNDAINEFMFSFNGWLDSILTCPSGDQPRGSDGGKLDTVALDSRGRGRTKKRKLVSDRSDDSQGRDGEGGGKKPPSRDLEADWVRMRYLACPYLKHDPQFFRTWDRGACLKAWKPWEFQRVKEHLERCHGPDWMCWICGMSFEGYNQLSPHIHEPHSGMLPPVQPVINERGRMTASQVAHLRVKSKKANLKVNSKKGDTNTSKFGQVYRILFPGVKEADIPSPYWEAHLLASQPNIDTPQPSFFMSGPPALSVPQQRHEELLSDAAPQERVSESSMYPAGTEPATLPAAASPSLVSSSAELALLSGFGPDPGFFSELATLPGAGSSSLDFSSMEFRSPSTELGLNTDFSPPEHDYHHWEDDFPPFEEAWKMGSSHAGNSAATDPTYTDADCVSMLTGSTEVDTWLLEGPYGPDNDKGKGLDISEDLDTY